MGADAQGQVINSLGEREDDAESCPLVQRPQPRETSAALSSAAASGEDTEQGCGFGRRWRAQLCHFLSWIIWGTLRLLHKPLFSLLYNGVGHWVSCYTQYRRWG